MDAEADSATSNFYKIFVNNRGCFSFDIGIRYIYIYIFISIKGGIAQLARACVLHTQGYRFDSDYLQLI